MKVDSICVSLNIFLLILVLEDKPKERRPWPPYFLTKSQILGTVRDCGNLQSGCTVKSKTNNEGGISIEDRSYSNATLAFQSPLVP